MIGLVQIILKSFESKYCETKNKIKKATPGEKRGLNKIKLTCLTYGST